MTESERRVYTDGERAAIIEGYREWTGSQASYAESVGVSQSTISRWLADSGFGASGPAAPALLEVLGRVPAIEVEALPARSGVLVRLGGGVELFLEALPPAQWVAELAAELRRC